MNAACPSSASVAAFKCWDVPLKILSGVENQGKPTVGKPDLIFCRCEPYCGTEKIVRRVRGRLCSHPFGRAIHRQYPVSKDMRSMSVKLSTKRSAARFAKITREGALGGRRRRRHRVHQDGSWEPTCMASSTTMIFAIGSFGPRAPLSISFLRSAWTQCRRAARSAHRSLGGPSPETR